MKEIKQWEDRKKRAVTKGEKKFIEKQIKELKDNMNECRSKATSFKKGGKMERKDFLKSFEIFNSNMKINMIKAYKYPLSDKRWRRGTIKQVGYDIYVYLKGKVLRDIVDLDEILEYLDNNTINIHIKGWESKVRRVDREAVKAEKFMKELDELKRDKVAEYEKVENEEIEKSMTRKEKLQSEIRIYRDMIERLQVELEQTISTSNIERIKNTIDSHKEQIEEDLMEIAKISKKNMELDEIQNYLRNYDGLLFINDGRTNFKVLDLNYEGEDIVAETEHQGMKIVVDDLGKLYKRMKEVRRLVGAKRTIANVNWNIKEMRDYYKSDEFQFAGLDKMRSKTTRNEAEKNAEELEKVVKEKIEIEIFLMEQEIKRIEKLKHILEHYKEGFRYKNQYAMTCFNDKGQAIL